MATRNCSPDAGSKRGAGTVVRMVSNSGSRLSPSALRSVVAVPTRAFV